MKLDVHVIGTLIRPHGKDIFEHECADGTTIARLLTDLKYDPRHIPHIMVSVDGELKHHDHVLKDGQTVSLSVTVGGG